MAGRSPHAQTRRIASPAMKTLMSRRSAEFGGLLLGLFGLVVLVALATYDPRDPSFDTATSRHVGNIAGQGGAILADILLQGFGIAGILPGVTMLAWGWRIASGGGLGSMALRLAALLAAMPVLAAVLETLPPPHQGWPVIAGLGGSIGGIIAAEAFRAGHASFGIVGTTLVWLIGAALAVALALLSLGLSSSEWRSLWRIAAITGRYSLSSGRGTAGALARGAGNVGTASGWLVNLMSRGPGLAPDEPEAAPKGLRPVVQTDMQTATRKPPITDESPADVPVLPIPTVKSTPICHA